MKMKKSISLLLVLLLTPLVLVGVVQSVGPPTIYINVSSYGITVYGNNWTPYTDVTIYYDVEDADHLVAVVTANYGGYFQTNIPTDYIPTVGIHTVIAVQGADKATALNNVGTTAPPDDRLLNPILNINNFLQNDIKADLQSIKNTLAQPLEVTNPPGESLNVNVTNRLHTAKWDRKHVEEEYAPGFTHTIFSVRSAGYRQVAIGFRNFVGADIEFTIYWYVNHTMPILLHEDLFTVTDGTEDYLYKSDVIGEYFQVHIRNLGPADGSFYASYYMTT